MKKLFAGKFNLSTAVRLNAPKGKGAVAFLVGLMLAGLFVGLISLAPIASAINNEGGSEPYIASLITTMNTQNIWTSDVGADLEQAYCGLSVGTVTLSQFETYVYDINVNLPYNSFWINRVPCYGWEAAIYWELNLQKMGAPTDITAIEAALNAATVDSDGLPEGGIASGWNLYMRSDIQAYAFANQLQYETSKWNITKAYNTFLSAVNTAGYPPSDITSAGVAYSNVGGTTARYYDEAGETMDTFLEFYLAGIPSALNEAEIWWSWAVSNDWHTGYSGGDFFTYRSNWLAFECEAGGFDSMMWKLLYYNSFTPNIPDLFTDMETRWLGDGWNSPQWNQYVAVHAEGVNGGASNAEQRLANTIMSWAVMFGLYSACDNATMQSQIDALLDGQAAGAPNNESAWYLLFQSGLYCAPENVFFMSSEFSAPDYLDSPEAIDLLLLLSIVPQTGSLAIPLQEYVYQDVNNIISPNLFDINTTANTLTVSVLQGGSFQFLFGSTPFNYTLPTAGIWTLNFASDWNSIVSASYKQALPASEIFLGQQNMIYFPSYSNAIVSSTDTQSNCIFGLTMTDMLALDPNGQYQFGTNNTGSWVWTSLTNFTSTLQIVSVTKTLTSIVGAEVDYEWNFTNNAGYSSSTGIQSLTTTLPTPQPSPSPSPTPTPAATPTPSPDTPTPTQAPSNTPTPRGALVIENPTATPKASSAPQSFGILEFPLIITIIFVILLVTVLSVLLHRKFESNCVTNRSAMGLK